MFLYINSKMVIFSELTSSSTMWQMVQYGPVAEWYRANALPNA